MTNLSPVPIPPRQSPACRSLSETPFALEPWDHRLPTRSFAPLLPLTFAGAEWGSESRASTGRGTCRARPNTAPGVPPSPLGHWPRHPVPVASPTTGRVCAAHPLGIPRPDGSIVRPATCGVPCRRARALAQAYRRPPCPGL